MEVLIVILTCLSLAWVVVTDFGLIYFIATTEWMGPDSPKWFLLAAALFQLLVAVTIVIILVFHRASLPVS